ncbi:Ribonuclease HII [Caenispirillum salinarum AK4]|uniref:Ribonuclease HII n=1 Tax=Caenispirillum salinarum AK4 TaxID=1238182 RepID=K9HIX8_9PROT|nr:ribonuclease HII [Caenispirillum salinarum]EKV28561.1 Ribonuclease HII [Caenispirillum salinarum AK4]
MPDFQLEWAETGVVCGIDEAGRGPLAGPVVAAAVILDRACVPDTLVDGLNDSKKLTASKREELLTVLETCGAAVIGIGQADVAEIDTHNILRATHMAMDRACGALGRAVDVALVDGNQPPALSLDCAVRTVVGGDGLSLSIAAASIVAKVTRDRIMAALAVDHPHYGWERNAGYGTAEHRTAMLEHGVCVHHRRSFAPVRDLCA